MSKSTISRAAKTRLKRQICCSYNGYDFVV